jgi:hypothetical protein
VKENAKALGEPELAKGLDLIVRLRVERQAPSPFPGSQELHMRHPHGALIRQSEVWSSQRQAVNQLSVRGSFPFLEQPELLE